MYQNKAYSAATRTSPLVSTLIPRRDPSDRDVQIDILFFGICHSDLVDGVQRSKGTRSCMRWRWWPYTRSEQIDL